MKKSVILYPVLFLCGVAIAYGIHVSKADTPSKQNMQSMEDDQIQDDETEDDAKQEDGDESAAEDASSDTEETANLPDSYYLSYKESDQLEGKAGFKASDFTLDEPRDFVMSVKKYNGSIQIRFTEHDSGTELYSSGVIGDEFNDTVHLEPGFYRFHLDTYVFQGVLDVQGVKTEAD